VVQFLRRFNNIAFLHDLSSRPGFTTARTHRIYFLCTLCINLVKFKSVPLHAMEAHEEREGIAPIHS
jgi:hypothetical protein